MCCAAAFAPCFVLGSNVKMLHSGAYHSPCADVRACRRSEACVKFLVPYMCLFAAGWSVCPVGPLAFCPAALYTASYRHRIRKEFGITSSGQCVPAASPTTSSCTSSASPSRVPGARRAQVAPALHAAESFVRRQARLDVVSKKKKEAFKWSFNLDELSDDEDDDGRSLSAGCSGRRHSRRPRALPAWRAASAAAPRLFRPPPDPSGCTSRTTRCTSTGGAICAARDLSTIWTSSLTTWSSTRTCERSRRDPEQDRDGHLQRLRKPFNNVPALGAPGYRNRGD